VLRGSRSLGLPGDARATSNDSGYASFVLPALALPGAYRFEVVTGSGVRLPGRPVVTLTVRAGRPASVTVEPRVLTFDRPGDTLARVAAVVRDPLGNPVPGEVAELHLGPGRTVSAVTDSAGRARFTLRRGGIPTGTFDVRVRGESMAQLRTARADAVSEAETGFLAPPEAGAAGTAIPLVFQVRAVSGAPMAGRPVSFRALNARVRPDSAVTDARGEVAVEAMLGERAGVAAVFGVVDSLERVLTLRVEAAVAVELRLERDGQRVDGGRVQVRYGQPFALKLTAHDAYGNQTAVWPIARVLRENREQLSARLGLLELVDVQDDGAAALLTLKPIRFGRVELTIASGATATGVTVEVVRRWP
jgi:hypothetical protein